MITALSGFALHRLLFALLLTAAAWLGLELLAGRLAAGSLPRQLLQRTQLSLTLTLLVAGLSWWLFDQLDRAGLDLPRHGYEVRDAVLNLGLIWTVLRCKGVLLRRLDADPRWLPQRNPRDRRFLIDLFNKLITTVVVVVGLLELLRLLGVSPVLLLTASGIGAAAVGFGAKALVENLISGVMLYINRPFGIGDLIEIPDRRLSGTVRAVSIFYTELITAEREPVYVPNAVFSTGAVSNLSRRDQRRLVLELALRPEDAGRCGAIVSQLTAELAEDGELSGSLPRRVHLSGLDDGRPRLRLECFCDNDADQAAAVRQRWLLRIAAVLAQHGGALAAPG